MECIYLTSVRKGSWEIVRVTVLRAGEMRAWDKVYPADVPFSPLRALLDAQEILNTDEKQYFYFESKELAERVESEYERIVITDGQSYDNGLTASGEREITTLIKNAKKDKTIVVAAGIGNDRESVKAEFGENFMDISVLQDMPMQLIDLIKANLWV